MLTYIDHVTLAVRDLDLAISTFRRRFSFVVGKKQTAESPQLANAVIPLGQGYLELLSPSGVRSLGPSPIALRLGNFLEAQEGLFSFAVRSSSIQGDVAALQERGSTLEDPQSQGGDGADWATSFPAEQEAGGPYVIQHDSESDAIRQAALSQPFALRSIEEVVVIVRDVEEAIGVYDRDLGLTPRRRLGGRAQLPLVGSKILLAPASMAPLGVPLGLYSVSLGTTDINGARTQLRLRNVEFQDDPFSWGVASQIDPAETFGARISLVQM
jgi:catechol 2,3-dioxygenase-like lactoylglutathione lyase family enzyme